ncbi:hypothetical protein [Streptomyces sp. NPDC050759]|uniref:hypothetical protein n=1 Tax=Streptomyces sp. NPDC050759 TaxID=3365635 RepID=UPI0037978D43
MHPPAAAEALLKAPLLREHGSLVIKEPGSATRKDFESATFDPCCCQHSQQVPCLCLPACQPASLPAVDATILGMPLCDYFSAADDQAAVAVLQIPGGTGRADLDVVSLKNIDPVVAMAQLEAIMTGCTYEEASGRPRSGQLLSDPEQSGVIVVSLTDTLTAALASTLPDDLLRFAESWSTTDELRQIGISVESTAGVLGALAGLAQRAHTSGRQLYCRWAL